MTRRSPGLVVLAGLALTLAACGARVDSSLRSEAANQELGRNGGGGGGLASGSGSTGTGSGTGSTGSSTGTGSTGSTGTTGGGGTTSGAGTGGSGSGSATGSGSGGGTGAQAPAGGNGGATDIGVTATSITVGNVADASGPVPGLFKGAFTGTQAYFNMINSQGGVFGRQIKIDFGDGQLNCNVNKSATDARVSKVFAFVGNFSLYDSCGAQTLAKHPDVPNVSNYLSSDAGRLPNTFATAPLGNGWRTGPLNYYKKTYGAKWAKIGGIFASVGSGPTVWANTKKAIDQSGGKVVYDESYGATTTDYTGTVIRMRNAGVQMIYTNTTDGANTARLVNAVRGQNLNWPIIFGATAYAQAFLDQAGANAEGTLNDQQFAMFFNSDEAAKIPTVAAYQKWMNATDGGQPEDIFSAYGWTSAGLFVDALKKAGPKATRKSLLAALKTFTSYDSYGMFANANPAGHKPAVCWLLTEVKNGKFVRVPPSPAKGFICSGASYFPAA